MSESDDAAQDYEQLHKALAIAVLEQHVTQFQLHVALRRLSPEFGRPPDLALHDQQSLDMLTQIQKDLHFFVKPYPTSPTQSGGSERSPVTTEDPKDDQQVRGQGTSPPSGGPANASSFTCPHCTNKLMVTLTKG